MERAAALDSGKKAVNQAHHGGGVDGKRRNDVLFRQVAERRQTSEAGSDEQSVDVGETSEEIEIVRFEIEAEGGEFGVLLGGRHLVAVDDVDALHFMALGQ